MLMCIHIHLIMLAFQSLITFPRFSSLLTKNSPFQIFYYSHWNLVVTESKEEVMLSLIIYTEVNSTH